MERDPLKALPYLERACMFGGMTSCRNLSLMYARGDGVARSEQQSHMYYNRFAELLEAQTGKRVPRAVTSELK